MNKQQARELADLLMQLARSAAFHSDDIYTDRDNVAEKLLEIFGESE